AANLAGNSLYFPGVLLRQSEAYDREAETGGVAEVFPSTHEEQGEKNDSKDSGVARGTGTSTGVSFPSLEKSRRRRCRRDGSAAAARNGPGTEVRQPDPRGGGASGTLRRGLPHRGGRACGVRRVSGSLSLYLAEGT